MVVAGCVDGSGPAYRNVWMYCQKSSFLRPRMPGMLIDIFKPVGSALEDDAVQQTLGVSFREKRIAALNRRPSRIVSLRRRGQTAAAIVDRRLLCRDVGG